jgi:hypothetical protein
MQGPEVFPAACVPGSNGLLVPARGVLMCFLAIGVNFACLPAAMQLTQS